MASRSIIIGVLAFIAIHYVNCTCVPSSEPTPANIIPSNTYPNPKRDETIQDTYCNNVVIKDPYRWMEITNSTETKKFIQDEMAITKNYLDKSPFRNEIQARYKELYGYPKYLGPWQAGNKFYFFQLAAGSQDQSVLLIQDSYKDQGKVFIDPNTWGKVNNETLLLSFVEFSNDGLTVAIATTTITYDYYDIQFKDIAKGDIYKDKLIKVKFARVSWTHDSKGVFYSGFPNSNGAGGGNTEKEHHKIFYHVLNTEQCNDVMVAEFPEIPADDSIEAHVSDCGKYLIVTVTKGSDKTMVYVADLSKINYQIKAKLELIPIVTTCEKYYSYVTNTESAFIFQTNKDAENYKLISIDVKNPSPNTWKDLVPANKDVLDVAYAAYEKYLVLSYTQDVKTVLQVHEIATGKMVKKLPLDIGKVDSDGFYSDKRYKDIFFNFESFLSPGITYRCDLSNPAFELEIVREIPVKNFDRTKFTSEQVFFKSKDGTQIPMFLIYKTGLQKNGNHLAYMTGYGASGSTTLPSFDGDRLVIIDNFDGVHAEANVRGGGEYGEKWHHDGRLDKKQNTFNDFQAAAEFLIAEQFTNNKLLVIDGELAGGLMMGVCLNQRPDLFAVVIGNMGFYDMLRYDKISSDPKYLIEEYGTASKPEDFAYLIKYSPLQNIKIPTEADKQYPATMLTAANEDDNLSHSLKFIAELQYQAKSHPNQKNPFIIKVESYPDLDPNHRMARAIEIFSDMMSFIVLNTGAKFHT